MTYRAYGRVVASDLPLPELEAASGTTEITITWSAGVPAGAGAEWKTLWRFSTGEPWVTTAHVSGVRFLRFGRFADCTTSEGRIDVSRRGHASDSTIRHLVLDQALPLALAATGALVVHASALAIGSRAILLAGRAGVGKSTLAAFLAGHRMQVLADDGAVLDGGPAEIRVLPSYPGLRLYHDSAAAAALDVSGSRDVAAYTKKRRIVPPVESDRGAAGPFTLAAIYVLCSADGPIAFDRLSRRDATLEVLSHAYRIDPGDRSALAAQLDAVAAIAPPVWRVSYPRDLARAAAVAESIASHAAELG